jgi:hypothetical protein
MSRQDDHYYFGELGSLPAEPAEAPSSWVWQATKRRFGELISRSCRFRQFQNQQTCSSPSQNASQRADSGKR